jgi:hypothetical protein
LRTPCSARPKPLNARIAGSTGFPPLPWHPPTEAAWELLGEGVDPFLEEMKRHIDLGFEAQATGTCAGIVLGLYRCRGRNSDQVLGWAEHFPAETAGQAVATLARESTVKHRRSWRLSEASVDQVPEWAEMIGRASKPASGRR